MNKSLSIILVSVALVTISCQKQDRVDTKEFEFTILGNIENGEDIELSLYIPSQGLDSRIKSTVKNGKYLFKGKAGNIEEARIRFEENIIDESLSWSYAIVFIEPGTTRLNFTITGDSLHHYPQNIKVSRGVNNKYYYDVRPHYWKSSAYTMFGDPSKMDSMHQYVYPAVRKKVLKTYDSLFSNTEFPEVGLSFFNSMVKNYGAFQFDKLNEVEKEKVFEYFNQIDISLEQTHDYRLAKNNIGKLKLLKSKDSFKDFELVNVDDKKVRLSEIVSKNEITVLYFWWTGCVPCRKFNRETTAEKYSLLKENKIEIISISVDDSNQRWKKASRIDSISWTNLYAGAVSDIELEYNVEVFPTKIIYDGDFNIIDFDFKDASELLSLVEK